MSMCVSGRCWTNEDTRQQTLDMEHFRGHCTERMKIPKRREFNIFEVFIRGVSMPKFQSPDVS